MFVVFFKYFNSTQPHMCVCISSYMIRTSTTDHRKQTDLVVIHDLRCWLLEFSRAVREDVHISLENGRLSSIQICQTALINFVSALKKKQRKKNFFLFCGRRQELITACDVWERQLEELYRGCEAWESNVKLQIASGWYWLKHFQILGPNWEHFFWDPKLEHLYEGQEESLRLWCHVLLLLLLLCFWQTSCHINPRLLLHLQLLPIIHIKVSTYPSVLERNPRKRTYENDGCRLMMSSVWDFSSFYPHSLLGIYFHSKDTT